MWNTSEMALDSILRSYASVYKAFFSSRKALWPLSHKHTFFAQYIKRTIAELFLLNRRSLWFNRTSFIAVTVQFPFYAHDSYPMRQNLFFLSSFFLKLMSFYLKASSLTTDRKKIKGKWGQTTLVEGLLHNYRLYSSEIPIHYFEFSQILFKALSCIKPTLADPKIVTF